MAERELFIAGRFHGLLQSLQDDFAAKQRTRLASSLVSPSGIAHCSFTKLACGPFSPRWLRVVALMHRSLSKLSDEELLLLRASLRAEMRKRGMADSVGAVGERLAIEYLRKTPGLPKLQLSSRGTKNVDALSRNGDRFSIKTVCEGSKTGTIYPEPDNREKQLFEHMLW